MSKLPQMDPVDPTPPPPPLDTTAPPAAPKPPSKLRTYITIAVLVLFVGVVLYATRNNTAADNLAVGTCFNEPAAGKDFSTVEKHECTEPHDAEVVFVTEYTDKSDTLPIKLTMESFVNDSCVPAIEIYTGRAAEDITELGVGYITPNDDGWKNGDRTITCYIYNLDASKLSKSVKGSATAS